MSTNFIEFPLCPLRLTVCREVKSWHLQSLKYFLKKSILPYFPTFTACWLTLFFFLALFSNFCCGYALYYKLLQLSFGVFNSGKQFLILVWILNLWKKIASLCIFSQSRIFNKESFLMLLELFRVKIFCNSYF